METFTYFVWIRCFALWLIPYLVLDYLFPCLGRLARSRVLFLCLALEEKGQWRARGEASPLYTFNNKYAQILNCAQITEILFERPVVGVDV